MFSPRLIFRTAFVTHEQIMLQYSRYFYGERTAAMASAACSRTTASRAAALMGVDKNAAQIAAIIWF